jgi:hypothetical protein
MTPPAKDVCLWIESPGAMAAANTMRRSGELVYRPELAVDGRQW